MSKKYTHRELIEAQLRGEAVQHSVLERMGLIAEYEAKIKEIKRSFHGGNDRQRGITDFGAYVRRLRVMCDVTLSEMAHALEVSTSYASGVECGRHILTMNYATKVVNYFAEKHDLHLCSKHIEKLYHSNKLKDYLLCLKSY